MGHKPVSFSLFSSDPETDRRRGEALANCGLPTDKASPWLKRLARAPYGDPYSQNPQIPQAAPIQAPENS